LFAHAVRVARDQLLDGVGLVAGRLKRCLNSKWMILARTVGWRGDESALLIAGRWWRTHLTTAVASLSTVRLAVWATC